MKAQKDFSTGINGLTRRIYLSIANVIPRKKPRCYSSGGRIGRYNNEGAL